MVNVNKNVNIFSVNSNHHRTSGTRTYTRAMGQHSIFSQGGWHGAARGFNAYDPSVNLNRYARMREGLNNRWDNYEHYHHGPQVPQEQNPSLLETLMVAIPLGKQIFDFGKDIAKTFNIGGGKKTGDVKGGNGADPSDSVPDSKSNIDFKNIKSFSDIDNLQEKNLTSLTNFNQGYQKASVETSVSETLGSQDVQAGLKLIDDYNLTTKPLALSEVKIDTKNPNFTEALKTIDKDISEINTYVETNIKGAEDKLVAKSGELSESIAELTRQSELTNDEATKKNLEAQIAKYKTQLEQVEKAKTALVAVTGQCNSSIEQLEAKKAEVQTAQENHNKLQDKKYNMAKEQDEKLGKVNAEIAKLKAEITKLGTPEAGSKDQKKLNELRAKITSAYNESTALITSLKSVARTKITNSAGTEYKIKNLATNSQPAGGGGGNPNNT